MQALNKLIAVSENFTCLVNQLLTALEGVGVEGGGGESHTYNPLQGS